MGLHTHEADPRKLAGILVHTGEGLRLIEVLCGLHSRDRKIIGNMTLFVPTGARYLDYDLRNEKIAAVYTLQNSKPVERKEHGN